MQDFEQKLASMTPRILVRPVKERHSKNLQLLRSFGMVAASFLLGAGMMYYVMMPKESIMESTTKYTQSRVQPRFVLDDETLQKIQCPMDIAKLKIHYEPVEKIVEPDCTYRAMILRIEN
jgi:hypothetical protein